MKRFACLAVLALAAGLAGPAVAQNPFGQNPFGGSPFGMPIEPGKMQQCSKDYIKSVEQQLAMYEKFRASGPEMVGQVCSLIESGSALFGGELPDSVRQQLKQSLGVDVDLRYIKTQCRVGQGNLDREMMSQIGLLKSELLRCGDSI